MNKHEPTSIAFVCSSAAMGGVEFSTLYLARELDKTRFRPLVVCPGSGDLPDQCRAAHIPTLIMPCLPNFSTSIRLGHHIVPNPFAWAFDLVIILLTSLQLASALRRRHIDIVCSKGLRAHFSAGLAAKLLGLPCVWHMQDLISQRNSGLRVRLVGWAARLFADSVIADGGPIARQLNPFVPSSRLSIIHNGVDTNLFSPAVSGAPVRAEWAVGDNNLLIGNVARLTPWKGQDYLLRAFAAVAPDFPNARLALIGAALFDSAAFEHELKRLARQLGIADRVLFAGQRWDLPQALAALDVYVHCSIEKDTSPLAVVSAMAAGKAIVATAVAGVSELFAPGQAIIVEPASVPALAAGLTQVLRSDQLRAELGQAARREAAQNLDVALFTRRCETVFAATLARRNGARKNGLAWKKRYY